MIFSDILQNIFLHKIQIHSRQTKHNLRRYHQHHNPPCDKLPMQYTDNSTHNVTNFKWEKLFTSFNRFQSNT